MKATGLWLLWQALLAPYAVCFHDQRGFRRFVEWITGLALNVEEHTITQSLVGLDREPDWHALEAFAEYAAFDTRDLERVTAQVLEDAPGRCWYGFHVWAGDDSKVHRTSKDVWGTCTFHEPSARCPNRATTVRAHNWVVVGALLANPGQPAWFAPTAGRLYFRRSQLPAAGNVGEEHATFHTKCELLVELARQQARAVPGPHLLVHDGAFAVHSVVRSLVCPESPEVPRIDVVTRLRHDARLHVWPPPEATGRRGRPPVWGRRLPPPRQGGRWPGPWQEGKVFVYGRLRTVRYKEVICRWRVLGADVAVKAVVAEVQGYKERFTLVSTALALTGLQVVELFCARFRQEDGFRDLKQRLGWEECRAWTRLPIVRTTAALLLTLTLLRRLQFALDSLGRSWWHAPPWRPHKERPSILDGERLLRRHREDFQRFLSAWLAEAEKSQTPAAAEDAA
jgi:DDE superfamily endonuclease